MRKYQIDLYRNADNWTAVVSDLLVVGEGATPDEATADAVTQAENAETRLTQLGLAERNTRNDLRIRYAPREAVFSKVSGIVVEYGLRAIILLMMFGLVYIAVRADIGTEIKKLRDDVSNLAGVVSDVGTTPAVGNESLLQQRARKLNEKLLPAARELRPLMRTLFGDEPLSPSPE